MRLVFAGTPGFAAAALQAILQAGLDVALVLTRPDRPAGRGLKPQTSEVKALALERGLPLAQPATLKSADVLVRLQEANSGVMVVAAYGLLLPQSVLDSFPLGCINIHASLLPRWRGAAPIQRAILAGDRETGISIMHMEAGLDTGPVYLTERMAIGAEDNAATLHDKLAVAGGRAVVQVLRELGRSTLTSVPQPADGVTYAHKIDKAEACIDWRQPAVQIERQVRAFNPYPVANTSLRGETLRVWRAAAVSAATGEPGRVAEVSDTGIVVACGQGALRIDELQRAGGKRLPTAQFLRGAKLHRAEQLGT